MPPIPMQPMSREHRKVESRYVGRGMRTEEHELLRVEDLRVHFSSKEGTVRAVDGVDFGVREGETLAIVGESGCGKSVTARAIMQIVPAPGRIVGGRIVLRRRDQDPVDLVRLRPDGWSMRRIRGKTIAMIFQEPMTSLSPVHTIGNQIMEAIRLHFGVSHGEARDRAIQLLERVGIAKAPQRIDSYPFQLSGGMRQRAMIAMALSCRPRMLVADEPTTALDVTIQAQILDLMQGLQRDLGMSILLITHNLGVVAKVAHDVVVMYLGRIVEEAPVRKLLRDPQHPYTSGLLRAVPAFGGRRKAPLVPIEGTVPSPHEQIRGCPFHPRCAHVMIGKCDKEVPALTRVQGGSAVRCFLYSDTVEDAGERGKVGRA